MKLNSLEKLVIDGTTLTLDNLIRVARANGTTAEISEESELRMKKSREWVDQVQKSGEPAVYGVNTGFGSKATVSISKERLKELQRNLIMSHAAGTGDPLPIDVVRAAMLLRANTLARGFSGIRIEVVKTLLKMLEKNVIPWIPEQGSLGASGDLAPLAHLALIVAKISPEEAADGEAGQAFYLNPGKTEWELYTGRKAMELAGIPQIELEAKEGLALNNGTQISTALLALAMNGALQLAKQADIAMAMTLEALLGISSAFNPEIHKLRPHPRQLSTAENIIRLTEGSKLIDSLPKKVQDAYSVRCHPQVMGGVKDTLDFILRILDTEMNSTNDNPIIIPDLENENKAIAGGNFHAQPIAFAADFLSIVLCEVGSISERRIYRLSDKNLSEGLPSFLIDNSGLESGLMIAQYTAASLVSENKSLAHPASIDSIPTCENQEDHVSMAPIAARKARQILENVQKIVAIEFLFAAQALDFRLREFGGKDAPDKILGRGTVEAYKLIREHVSFMDQDRPVYADIENMVELIRKARMLEDVERRAGKLN